MKLKELECCLGDLEGFRSPRIDLEQYETQPHLAARTLFCAEQTFGDISEKIVGDLGCGPGRLTIGASLLGANLCYGFDIDPSVADIFCDNCVSADTDNVEFVLDDVFAIDQRFDMFFDTVILNPPFGTKGNKGNDIKFLLAGLRLSNHAVYSFHKSVTRAFILGKAREWKVKMEVVAELNFDLPQTYKRHKKETLDVKVDFLRTTHHE